LRYVIVSGKVTLYQSKNFCKYIIFTLLTTWLRGPDKITSRAVVWRPLVYKNKGAVSPPIRTKAFGLTYHRPHNKWKLDAVTKRDCC